LQVRMPVNTRSPNSLIGVMRSGAKSPCQAIQSPILLVFLARQSEHSFVRLRYSMTKPQRSQLTYSTSPCYKSFRQIPHKASVLSCLHFGGGAAFLAISSYSLRRCSSSRSRFSQYSVSQTLPEGASYSSSQRS